jgi:hypothetical protein
MAEKKALFTIKGLPFDNTYQGPINSYLFIPGRYTEVYGDEDIAYFRAKRQCTEKKLLKDVVAKLKGAKGKGKGAKAEKEDKKAEAGKKKEKEDKPKEDNPLDNL